MDSRRRREVNHAFANAGKAIAACERMLLPERSRFDRCVAELAGGDAAAAGAADRVGSSPASDTPSTAKRERVLRERVRVGDRESP